LNPKKPSYFLKLTAEQHGVSEELVKDIIDMYWEDVRKSLSELKHHSVYVVGLGTFKIKYWKLDEKKVEYCRMLASNNGNSFKKMVMQAELEDRIEKFMVLQEMLFENNKERKLKKTIRYAKINSDLEKQVSNIGGSNELNPEEGTGRGNLPEENEDMQSMHSSG
jgi:hypothetical protein